MTNEISDQQIKNGLRQVANEGKLGILAHISGIQGGENRLREIMESDDEIHFLVRHRLLVIWDD